MLASDEPQAPVKTIAQINISEVIKIRKINIYESPILSATSNMKTVHIVLDTGATASLISAAKASELKLKIFPTIHRAVQVDGISNLKVLGEVHTEFTRGSLSLHFSGLVVNKLGTEILGGTNFHKENDVYSRMAKDMIVIKGSNIFQSTPVEIMKLDEGNKSAKLVRVKQTKILMPGDSLQFELPPSCPESGIFFVEPKYGQGDPLCEPQIVKAINNKIEVEVKGIKNDTPVKVMKNSAPIQVREAKEEEYESIDAPRLETPHLDFHERFGNAEKDVKKKTVEEKIQEVHIDQAMTMKQSEKDMFLETIKEFEEVLDDSLPGYNNYFGKVNASIKFASRARPAPHKTRMPSYGEHGQKLFNLKALAMVKKGVLVDPYKLGIQPAIINDSWVVKKQGSAHKKWEDCTEKDVRMVTGFDPVNKYLSQIPSKASDPILVYTHLASWKYLGELDFADMYWQLKFSLETMKEKRQLEYLCIRTIGGTLAYTRGPNGLLGMDAITDELTDKLLGDLVLAGKVVKLADNVYFGAETISGLHEIFHEIMSRCSKATLRIKPSKIHLNIANADILGLHWNRGTLTPSTHKLDPLAHCEKPKTVKGMRSFLGAVRFNEICLDSKELSNATELLDELTPASRAGKEVIEWNENLEAAFEKVQNICKNPQTNFVPKRGDSLFLVGDAAPSHGPGIGTKLVIQRQGSNKLLPSFNHGMRMKGNMKQWSACEVESYQLNQAIKKFKPFIRFVGTKTTALMDSRASVLAVQRLEKGQPSTSRRLQDLLANISAENIQVLHISAKLPSPLLQYVDFASRNPINCLNKKCTICEEMTAPDVTFFGEAFINVVNIEEVQKIPHVSVPMWKDIQTSSQDLKRAAALMESGKVPHKKEKRTNDISKYLRYCTLNKDGLVVAKNEDKAQPFLVKKQERIVIPREFAFTYTAVLHRKFNHPNKTQMLRMFNRRFYMLNAEEVISRVTESCEYPCRAMKQLPKETFEFQVETKPTVAGKYFNADVLQESGQKILVLRENLTSYTEAMFISNEQKQTLREAIIILCAKLRSNHDIIVRVDAQSSFKALKQDTVLNDETIHLEIGSAKNKNKNSVAEKAIREIREEIVKLSPHGGKISETVLAKAVRNLNFRVRHTGCSARELWLKRDQESGEPLEFDDKQVSDVQYQMRLKSHNSSAKYQSRGAPKVEFPKLRIGDMIYIKSDVSKNKARDPYVVLNFVPNKNEIDVQKLNKSKNKRNIIRVHLQNVFRVKPEEEEEKNQFNTEKIDEKSIAPKTKETKNNLEKIGRNNQIPKDSNKEEKVCYYCLKMKRKQVNHDYYECESLLQVRPGLRKKKLAPMSESDSEEDNENENRDIQANVNNADEVMLLFTYLPFASEENIAYFEREEAVHIESDSDEETNSEPQPPPKPPEISLDDLESNPDLSNDEWSDEVIDRTTVIHHDGACCPDPQPRPRLGGRSLPGRAVDERHRHVDDEEHPGSIPGRKLHTGDVIKYFTGWLVDNEEQWLRATIQPMTKKDQRRYPNYYNILNEAGEEKSLKLIEGGAWKVLRGDQFITL